MKKSISFAALCGILFCTICTIQAQTSTISGKIINEQNNQAIKGANILLKHIGGTFSEGTSSDDEGFYRIEELQAARYQLIITAIGYRTVQKQITLQPGTERKLNLSLHPSDYQLSEIVVEGTDQTDINPTTIQRITTEQIESQDVATSTVADIARLLPAAHVATNSRGQTIMYLRNSADRQTAQFFNGALINVPWDNRVDLGFLPSAMLGGVTVSKGVPSVVYGTNTIGGAVNFRARTMTDQGHATELTTTATSPGVGGASLLHMGKNNDFSYTAEASYSKRNDYALPSKVNLPYSQPSGETRVNTDRRHVNMFAQGSKQFENGAQIGATLFHVDAEKGVAPESNLDPDQTGVRYWRYPAIRQSMAIINGMAPLGPDSRIRGAAWFNRYTQDINQYQSVEYDQLDETQDDLDLTGGLRLIFEQAIGAGELDLALNALTTQHQQTIIPYADGSAGSDSSDTYGQQIYSLGAEYTLPLSSKLTSILGISYEGSAITNTGPWENAGYDDYSSSAVSLSAGLTYELSDRVLLRSVVGRKPRFPTMRELYNGALGKFVPNPNLKPVTAYLGELGIEWRDTSLSGSITAFLTRTYDAIDKRTIQEGANAGKEQRINLDGTRVWGVEATAAVHPFETFSIDGNLTYMHVRGFLDGDPRKLDEKPAWLGVLNVNYDITDYVKALIQTEYTGGIYARTEQNTFASLPDALILDTRLGYQLFRTGSTLRGGEIFFRVNNITNDKRILQLGLPGPGREYLAGLKLRF